MKEKVEKMDKCIRCLSLELPSKVYDDVLITWTDLKDAIEEERNPDNSWHD